MYSEHAIVLRTVYLEGAWRVGAKNVYLYLYSLFQLFLEASFPGFRRTIGTNIPAHQVQVTQVKAFQHFCQEYFPPAAAKKLSLCLAYHMQILVVLTVSCI